MGEGISILVLILHVKIGVFTKLLNMIQKILIGMLHVDLWIENYPTREIYESKSYIYTHISLYKAILMSYEHFILRL